MVSIILAKIFSFYFLVIGILTLTRAKEITYALTTGFLDIPFLRFFSGWIIFSLGLIIVFIHPVFSADWRIVITLLGIIFSVKGALQGFSEKATRNLVMFCTAKTNLILIGIGTLGLGAFFLLEGFILH